ncbi:MAG: hypothetical protein EBT40_05555 [Betaproteobacteria bacterium]|jgi:rubrerythrin|nr:hypothetical protein [Betaproteobacteria bacterium]NBY52138.1 hypothetical protein [Betaproteobacteria bacterium]NDD12649.1 hypothetical protein [Betaproteobacteria bacterium]
MADLLEMSCACGYRAQVRAGGLMRSFEQESWWPFNCKKCGVVNINWRNDVRCPSCATTDVTPYGQAPVSLDQTSEATYVQAWNYKASKSGHLCPRCGDYSLKFNRERFWVLAD